MKKKNGAFLVWGVVCVGVSAAGLYGETGDIAFGLPFLALGLILLAVYFVRELRCTYAQKPSPAALIVGAFFTFMGLTDIGSDTYGVALGLGVGLPLLAAWLLRKVRAGKLRRDAVPAAPAAEKAAPPEAEPPLKTCPHCGAPGRGSVCEYCGGPM